LIEKMEWPSVASLLDGEVGRYRKRATARPAGAAKELRRGRQVPQKSYGEVGRCRKRALMRATDLWRKTTRRSSLKREIV